MTIRIALAALALLLLVGARAFRDRMADIRLMQLDADDSDAVSDYVPMAAWGGWATVPLPESLRTRSIFGTH